jgi:hypothetical protein
LDNTGKLNMQKQFNSIIFFSGALLWVSTVIHAQTFVHPGILHSSKDLRRMKKAVANKLEPIFSGYQLFIQNPASGFNYKMQGPLDSVSRNPTVGQLIYDNDANAAHQNAVMWAITGDRRHAHKAIEIVNAWSQRLKSISGKDAVLMAGLGPFKMINAAEILRYTNSGWKDADIRQTEEHFKKVIYPVLEDFAPFANGNWDASAMKTMMAIAVFCNDRPVFERALRYYVHGHGNGSLFNYIVNEDGQIQESGRDQAHSQLGIGMLAECCAIAWNQGLDLYAYGNNRLLKGFEYTAKFNLGNDEVPFSEWLDRTGKYYHKQISQKARGELRAVYEQVYNHYVIEKGLSAPYMQQAAEKLRPEGPGKPGADHPGYGTLFFATTKDKVNINVCPAAPGAVIAGVSGEGVRLTWIRSIGADVYSIKRATKRGGPYLTIAKNVKHPDFVDKQIRRKTIYYYIVTASNAKFESQNSFKTAIVTDLPSPWKQNNIGNARGITFFDATVFTIEAAGKDLDSTNDQFHFTYHPMSGNVEIIARFVPQTSSQFSQMGLMMREGLDVNSSFVSLVIYPAKTGEIELPDWRMKIITRKTAGAHPDTSAISIPLSRPAVTWGRLTGYVWLRLQRRGNIFTGSFSYNGKSWQQLPTILKLLQKNLYTGFTVSSGMPGPTTVFIDHISIRNSK